jgi:hypothetical protein
MRQSQTEPHACGICLGELRPVRQVPVLKSLEGQRIFECADCGELILVALHGTSVAAWIEAAWIDSGQGRAGQGRVAQFSVSNPGGRGQQSCAFQLRMGGGSAFRGVGLE